ncbi:TIGR01906 family membrane protein [Lactobacillus sp. Sy-1]|uniref:TIGR01906 family membrane protein n=1 Tax=Lactobacillus sp. Sy-1 TaxID=2109645 RepID=UPI001C5673DA|nr:TIGR01906 family membrane protein [Lactobacillus sp. Sy-1]MBW1605754.1 TIGR01906 family membrane protein [Lactobacillus sp. Sy-1]
MISSWRDYLVTLLFELFFLTLSIFVVINLTPLYWLDIHFMQLTHATGLPANFIISDYLRVVNYIQNPFDSGLHFNHFKASSEGMQHFQDVKKLILLNNGVMIITGLISVRKMISLVRFNQIWRIMVPIRVILVLMAAVITLVLVNFDRAFIFFHEVVFRNKDWVFNPEHDPIINALPLPFFIQSFMIVAILILILNGIGYFLGKLSLNNSK